MSNAPTLPLKTLSQIADEYYAAHPDMDPIGRSIEVQRKQLEYARQLHATAPTDSIRKYWAKQVERLEYFGD